MKRIKILDNDTICAVSTPVGQGAIHIVRLTGKKARTIAGRVFTLKDHKKTFFNIESRKMYYGTIYREGITVDEACAVFFKKPHTYTCEDLVELYVHGNYMIAHSVIQLLVEHGARVAEKGEFTKRAFLNGRIDLPQAEAVNDLITAKTDLGVKVALDTMKGRLSDEMNTLKNSIIDMLSEVEAFIDFPDEDIEVFSQKEIGSALQDVFSRVEILLSSYEHGEILRDGIRTVIVGRPNVGKSSLLNTLLKRDRALVSNIPGTTRDTLEELIDIQGILFRIIDTPGMRKGKDTLEALSIDRARVHITEGQLFIFVVDNARVVTKEDKKIFEQIKDKNVILVANKSDLPSKGAMMRLKKWAEPANIISVSTVTRAGIKALEKRLVSLVWHGMIDQDDLVITSERQFEILIKMRKSLIHAMTSFKKKSSLEFLAFDLRESLDLLGEIVGEVYREDILDSVFSKFCIGK